MAMMTSMAKYTGSTPNCTMMGCTTGRVMDIIEIESWNMPRKKYMARKSTTTAIGGMPALVTQDTKAFGRPVNTRKRAKIMAPMRIKKTSAVVCAASFNAAMKLRQVRPPDTSARIRAPRAPAAPASVGVKTPVYMPMMMPATRTTMPHTPPSDLSRSPHDTVSSERGARRGRISADTTMPRVKMTVRMAPGPTPAMSRMPIDCSVRMP